MTYLIFHTTLNILLHFLKKKKKILVSLPTLIYIARP